MSGFRDVLIRGESSDGKMNGELKDRAQTGGINVFSARLFTRECVQEQRDWILLDWDNKG